MSKRVIMTISIVLLIVIGIFIYVSFRPSKESLQEEYNDHEEDVILKMKAIINGESYDVKMENNATVETFVTKLPKEFVMHELNGNEKYVYMDESLPANAINPQQIQRGDVMLYGDDCLVVFYQSFATSYSYTRIGHIDDLPDLGTGDITVKFEK